MRLSTSYFLIHGRQCCGFSLGDRSGPLQTRHEEELLLWTSKIRILRGAFWRTNRSYRFSLLTCQERNRNFWTGYSKYSRNTTHCPLANRTTPVRPRTESTLSSRWCA